MSRPPLRPAKHSLTLAGHRTSVSLEPEFWAAFRRLAQAQGRTVNDLATEIDAGREDRGLASAIRVFVLAAALKGSFERRVADVAGGPCAPRAPQSPLER